jgi:hypothetical protein
MKDPNFLTSAASLIFRSVANNYKDFDLVFATDGSGSFTAHTIIAQILTTLSISSVIGGSFVTNVWSNGSLTDIRFREVHKKCGGQGGSIGIIYK